MSDRIVRFGLRARQQQATFRNTLSRDAQFPDDPVGQRNGHLIAHGFEMENFCPAMRSANGAMQHFNERNIAWWTSARSGDRTNDPSYCGPTRNLASSQIACVNFLLPLCSIPNALLTFVQCFDEDAISVESIADQAGRQSLVEFEWVGWSSPLEGGRMTRGANQTSIDALMVAQTRRGRCAYLIEWKYCEEYRRPEDKGAGPPGRTRRSRYQSLFEGADSPFLPGIALDEFLFEPFYQIMRLHLLAARMRVEGVTPTLPIDDARVVVVCPQANTDYRRVVPQLPLARRFPEMKSVEEIVRATLRNPNDFLMVASEQTVAALRCTVPSPELTAWLDYHHLRYGW